MKCYIAVLLLVLCFPVSAQITPNQAICSSDMTEKVCKALKKAIFESVADEAFDTSDDLAFAERFNQSFKNIAKQPEFLNSLLDSESIKSRLDTIPLTMTFKFIDSEIAESVIGLEFIYAKQIKRWNVNHDGDNLTDFSVDLNLGGTLTKNAEENPRNFIELSVSARWSIKPSFSAKELRDVVVSETCNSVEMIDDLYCGELDRSNYLNAFSDYAGTWFTDYGVDFAYESDQQFEATNRTISAFIFAAYEDFDRTTFMGKYAIKPAFLLSIDTVAPSSDTPRSLAGDDSSYERLSGEFSLTLPLKEVFDTPYTLGFNYRAYQELSASDIVKNANLESYRLRTFSLNAPNGLVVSYSSGRLPFGIVEENIVELGFKTYF